MGIFNSLQTLTKAAVRTAILPVDIVKDVVTLGGSITDEESAVVSGIEEVSELLRKSYDEIDE